MKQQTKKFVKVKHNPGVYKIHEFNSRISKFEETDKYIAQRWVGLASARKRERAVFDSLVDARNYRAGKINKVAEGVIVEQDPTKSPAELMAFAELVTEWKEFHYMKLEPQTQQLYDRKIPHLVNFLGPCVVAKIDASKIDGLVKYWVKDIPRVHGRQSFEKELTLLTTILKYYKSRKNPAYGIPVFAEHNDAGVVKKVASEVKALSDEDLPRFYAGLKEEHDPQHYVLALTQFGLALRIGEACGLYKTDLNFDKLEAMIRRVVCWDDREKGPFIKEYPKTQVARRVAIPEAVAGPLKDWIAASDPNCPLVFRRKNFAGHVLEKRLLLRKSVGNAYNRVFKRLGLLEQASGTHVMRRSAATIANDITGDFHAVSATLGHSSITVTQRYVKKLSSQKRRVANALNSVLIAPSSGGDGNTPEASSKPSRSADEVKGENPQSTASVEPLKKASNFGLDVGTETPSGCASLLEPPEQKRPRLYLVR